MSRIPHSRPTIGPEEIKAVTRVMESGQIAQAKEVRKFEQAFARRTGIRYAAAVNSGTSALHLTLLALAVGADDEVIIPSYVCTALLNAVHYVGARPILVDIDPASYNLDPKAVAARLTRLTKAIIVPHMFGLAADINPLLSLNVPIIEDCAQAVGGTYQNKPLGTFGRAAVFSFYATKVMTTGEGGMVVSDSRRLINRVKDLREYDKIEAVNIRYNYKMTDIQAAMGRVQLNRLDEFIERRRVIAGRYRRALEGFDLILPPDHPGHIYYRYVIRLKTSTTPLIQLLRKNGMECARPVHIPLHLVLKLKGYAKAESAWRQSISIPIYPSLSDDQTEQAIELLKEVFQETFVKRPLLPNSGVRLNF